jgi:hydroxymethylbilane synthase
MVQGENLRLIGVVSSPDGMTMVRREGTGTVAEAERLGERIGHDLLEGGARDILATVYGHAG